MAAHAVIVIDLEKGSRKDLIRKIFKGNRWRDVRGSLPLIGGILGGAFGATVRMMCVEGASARASQTIGCDQSDAVDGTDEVVIAGVTLAVEAAPANENQFAKGADDIEFAANLAAAINAHSVLSTLFDATSDGVDTVTVTALLPGLVYNQVAITETGNGFTLGGAALTGGDGLDNANVQSYSFGA